MMNIILTGGGTAGHVTPNLALIPFLQNEGFCVHYIGMKNSIEESLICACPNVTFHSVRSGKFRRYFSWKNFSDPFRVLAGILDARHIIQTVQPAAIFSKGGFVTVPVAFAAKQLRIPFLLHESDYTPGLANRIAIRSASKVLVTFEDTLPHTRSKGICTGTPIRSELFAGHAQRGKQYLQFFDEKPILLCMGGSQGAVAINHALREALPLLLPRFNIVHLCGASNLDSACSHEGYRQFEYMQDELPDIMAAADVVVSRAGANSIFEFLAVGLPALLIPLPKSSSRGDQILNAHYFSRKGYASILEQENLTSESLAQAVQSLYANRHQYITTMAQSPQKNGTKNTLDILFESIAINQ